MKIEYTPIHFTRESHIVDYLEKALFYIKSTTSNPTDWKWVILSLHSALYNAAIAASRHSSGENIKDKRGKLITIGAALKQCQDKNLMEKYVISKALILTKEQKESLERLTGTFRNNFEHFQFGGWMIEIHGFPHMCIDVLDVIDFLIFKSQNCIHFDESQNEQIRKIIDESKAILSNTVLYKEAKYLLEQENDK